MTRADLLTLVSTLSLGRHDATECATFIAEELERLSKESEVVVDTDTTENTVAGTAVYSYSAVMGRFVMLLCSTRLLPMTPINHLEYKPGWQADTGTPLCYVREEEDSKTYRLYPKPTAIAALTKVFTRITDSDDNDVPDWLGLPIAFSVCWREFVRPSDHQDIEWGILCGQVAQFLYRLVGVL